MGGASTSSPGFTLKEKDPRFIGFREDFSRVGGSAVLGAASVFATLKDALYFEAASSSSLCFDFFFETQQQMERRMHKSSAPPPDRHTHSG